MKGRLQLANRRARPQWWALLLLLLLPGCTEREPPELPCIRQPHTDSTGHIVWCDCYCSADPEFACPIGVRECIELLGEGSSSDA